MFSALEVFYENALYKFTFDIDIDIDIELNDTKYIADSDLLVDDVVSVVGVTNGIGTSQQHLKRNVWDQFTQGFQSIPRTLVKEPQSYVESCT